MTQQSPNTAPTPTRLSQAELLQKANGLPLCPGVYLMKDRAGKVIYVGKSRKLKNRVSQYFQNSEKNAKTARMVEDRKSTRLNSSHTS